MTTNTAATLDQSTDMQAVHGTVDVDIPADVLWECFTHGNLWPRWNACMYWVRNRDLIAGEKLIWAFEPMRWWYFYKLPGVATLVEVEKQRRVTWEVTALPGFYARHTYSVEDLGNGRSRFGSWEKAMGPMFRALKFFWYSHFVFVKNRSLQGARLLDAIYRRSGQLNEHTLPRRRPLRLITNLKEMIGSLEILGMQYRQLAPDLWAVLGGGGNTLVLKSRNEVLLIDPKMPPYAGQLRDWIARTLKAPVTTLIDTHHHFDHTYGNTVFPQARIVAHRSVPDLMRQRDPGFWQKHPAAVPTAANLVDSALTVQHGDYAVQINHSRQAHTVGDLWAHLRVGDQEFVVTGDFATLEHYPFFDTGAGGADVPGWIQSTRELAQRYPKAIFVPGHGPLASAPDLLRHADYVEFLLNSVEGSRRDGLDEDSTVRNIDLSAWNLTWAPIFHYGALFLSASTNVHSVYQLQSRKSGS